MHRALALAARSLPSPNPRVGAVIVREGHLVAEGFHTRPGEPHAEAVALARAGEGAKGATVYVNLEPCVHHGRTPPCVDALLRAGVARVVVGIEDPDPKVQGEGIRRLREAGVEVTVGVLAREARRLNEAYLHHRRTGRPWVIGKWAMSWDGKIATSSGESRWLSGPEARRRVHRLRREVDAVMVGCGTALRDDPLLTPREEGSEEAPLRARPLWRVVVDSRGCLPLTARLVRTAHQTPTLVATLEEAPWDWRQGLEKAGVHVWHLPAREGRVDLKALLLRLGQEGILSVLVEGGGTLLAGLQDQGLLNKVWVFLCPWLIGGQKAPTPLEGRGVLHLSEAPRLREVRWEAVGEDLWLEGYLTEPE